MKVQTHYLSENKEGAFFVSYLLDDSKEFQTGRKRPAVIVNPGGGYLFTSDREAEPIAMEFLSKGYHAFVLRYTVGTEDGRVKGVYEQAIVELATTIKMIRENANEWLVDRDQIILIGFSAGGHLAISMGTHWHDEELAKKVGTTNEMLKPNAIILGYPLCDYKVMIEKGVADKFKDFTKVANRALTGNEWPDEKQQIAYSPVHFVSEKTPPVFIWHTANDELVFVENSLSLAKALSAHHVPYELHIFEKGFHGLSLSNEVTAGRLEENNISCQPWVDLAFKWLKSHCQLSIESN